MAWEWYLAYVATVVVLLASPGPTVMLVVSCALSHGRRTAPWTAAGVALGDLTDMVLSVAGLGAVLAASAELFALVKYAGAAYLIWLGVRMWRQGPGTMEATNQAGGGPGWGMLARAYAVTALNPKAIVFFVAFFPQFLDPARPWLPQVTLLGATFVILAGLNAWLYAQAAGRVCQTLARPGARAWLGRAGGSLLIGAGLVTATLKR